MRDKSVLNKYDGSIGVLKCRDFLFNKICIKVGKVSRHQSGSINGQLKFLKIK
jgi:hypothetical protein